MSAHQASEARSDSAAKAEASRRQGVAARLLSAAKDHAKSLGAVRVSLSTATTNSTAQALYRSAGWTRDERFLVYDLAITA